MEKNRNILKEALKILPAKSPDNALWNRIENELIKKEKLGKLSTHEPPSSVWDNIEKELPASKNRRNRFWLTPIKWSAVAAAVFIFGYLIIAYGLNPHNNISHSEKWVSIQTTTQWESENPETILSIICNENPTVCSTQNFKKVKARIEQLEKTKQTILSHFNKYDANSELKLMLTKIELEQAGLIKKIL